MSDGQSHGDKRAPYIFGPDSEPPPAPPLVSSLPQTMSEVKPLSPKSVTVERPTQQFDMVNNPPHYGGKDNPYEVIKVLRAWGYLNNAPRFSSLKYLARAGKKGDKIEDLEKAIYYINEEIAAIKDGTL